jgi:Leucine-rich repeat (LRR) protein
MVFLNTLPNLETIDANTCGIQEIDYDLRTSNSAVSYFLRHLHTLDVSSNNISNIKENCFFSLQMLKTLNLSNNVISYFAPEAFHHLWILEVLDLSNNSITHINETSFRDLARLEEFSLANNRLQMLNFHLFSNSSHLRTLNFHANHIVMLNYSTTIWKYTSVLDLSNNLIFKPDNIKTINEQFPHLRILNISIGLQQCDNQIKIAYPNLHVDYSCSDFERSISQYNRNFLILICLAFVYAIVLIVVVGKMFYQPKEVVNRDEEQMAQPVTLTDVVAIQESVL